MPVGGTTLTVSAPAAHSVTVTSALTYVLPRQAHVEFSLTLYNATNTLRSLAFWYLAQRMLVIVCRRFGQHVATIFKGQADQ